MLHVDRLPYRVEPIHRIERPVAALAIEVHADGFASLLSAKQLLRPLAAIVSGKRIGDWLFAPVIEAWKRLAFYHQRPEITWCVLGKYRLRR